MRRLVAVVLLSFGVGGCVHRGSAPAEAGDPNVITRDEIASAGGVTAYDVIARLRGRFLVSRGNNSILADPKTYAKVFLNDQPYGEISILRSVMASDLESIRYYSGPEAIARFGGRYGGGVIQLISRVE